MFLWLHGVPARCGASYGPSCGLPAPPLPAAPGRPVGVAPGSPAPWGHASRSEGVPIWPDQGKRCSATL